MSARLQTVDASRPVITLLEASVGTLSNPTIYFCNNIMGEKLLINFGAKFQR